VRRGGGGIHLEQTLGNPSIVVAGMLILEGSERENGLDIWEVRNGSGQLKLCVWGGGMGKVMLLEQWPES
jgi:hypothetical protein